MTAPRPHPKLPLALAVVAKPLAPCEAHGRRYPALGELLREPALRGVLRSAVLGSAALSAVALSGCEPPQCEPTRLGEITTHTGVAAESLTRLELKRSASELLVGFGLTAHPPAYMLGGAIAAVAPAPLPATPPPVTEPAAPTLPSPEE